MINALTWRTETTCRALWEFRTEGERLIVAKRIRSARVCVRAATISDRHGYADFGDYQQRSRIKRDKELSPRNLHKNHLR